MSTVSDLLKDSLRLIGAIASGESPSASEASDSLRTLNRMLSSWSVEGLLVYTRSREVFTLVGGQAAYTFGLTGDFNSVRPTLVEGVTALVNGAEVPLSILNPQEWAGVTLKSTSSSLPTKVYLEGTFPLETVNVWPAPTEAISLVFYSKKPLALFTSGSDVIDLPPGYEDALLYNLAVRQAPEYGKALDPILLEMAMTMKADIKRQNIKPVYMKSDAAGLSSSRRPFNVYTGE